MSVRSSGRSVPPIGYITAQRQAISNGDNGAGTRRVLAIHEALF